MYDTNKISVLFLIFMKHDKKAKQLRDNLKKRKEQARLRSKDKKENRSHVS
jgi:hypothetical protein